MKWELQFYIVHLNLIYFILNRKLDVFHPNEAVLVFSLYFWGSSDYFRKFVGIHCINIIYNETNILKKNMHKLDKTANSIYIWSMSIYFATFYVSWKWQWSHISTCLPHCSCFSVFSFILCFPHIASPPNIKHEKQIIAVVK